eukprot:gnl/TRDRNA2_/TRDRNA2_135680_c1_seq1.p1 gnl/TRDRNA2_/TRDRNA2_135680_c1~~gnl/TRDRNA2_/TRDRNA2_135680_c1_seq1.p1  ORF type:complete len:805 (-),score=82.25 gnl/TRDRNA2_/TRDRNA2_135680_c1_seq1:17-2206(-)
MLAFEVFTLWRMLADERCCAQWTRAVTHAASSALRSSLCIWCTAVWAVVHLHALFCRGEVKRRLQRALRHWSSYARTTCGGRLGYNRGARIAVLQRRELKSAVRWLSRIAFARREMRENMRRARQHIRQLRAHTALGHLHGLASEVHLRAARFCLAATWRRWRRCTDLALQEQEKCAFRASNIMKWRCSAPVIAWRSWRLRAAGRSKRLEQAASLAACNQATVLMAAMHAWRHALVCWRRAQAQSDALHVYRRKSALQRWLVCAVALRLGREASGRMRLQLARTAFRALDEYRRRKMEQETWRRRATRWRYLKALRRGIVGFQAVCERKADCQALVMFAAKRRCERALAVCARRWMDHVRPRLRVQARQQHSRSLLHRSVHAFAFYRSTQFAKRQKDLEAKQVLRILVAREALSRLALSTKENMRIRHSLSGRVLSGRRCQRERTARRAVRIWSLEFRLRIHFLREQHSRANEHRSHNLLRLTWATLLIWRDVQREAACRAAPGIFQLRLRCTRKWLLQWRAAAAGCRREAYQREEALLQWYVVLCTSTLIIWQRWAAARRQKRSRQKHAAECFRNAQRKAGVRMLLWRFDMQCAEEEAVAAACVAAQQQRRVELATTAAWHWRSLKITAGGGHGQGRAWTPDRAVRGGELPCGIPALPVWSCQKPVVTARTATTEAGTAESDGLNEALRSSWTPSLSDTSWPSPVRVGPLYAAGVRELWPDEESWEMG